MAFDQVSFENAFTCWMEWPGTCNCWISRESRVHLHNKTNHSHFFFFTEYKKGIHLGRHLYTGIKTFSFLCGRATYLVTEGEHQVLNGSHILVFFTRILLLFGTKCHYSCKRRHDEEGKQSDEAALRDLVLTFPPTIRSVKQRKAKLLMRVFNRRHLFKEGMALSPS